MDSDAREILGWVILVFRLLVLAGALGALLAVVRRASPRATYLLGAAMGLQLASICCWRATHFALRGEGYGDTYRYVFVANNCAGMLVDVASLGLVAYAFVVLARLLTARSAPPSTPAP